MPELLVALWSLYLSYGLKCVNQHLSTYHMYVNEGKCLLREP